MTISNQWSQSGPRADNIIRCKRGVRKVLVRNVQNISNFGRSGSNIVERSLVIGICRAQNYSLSPWDGEENPLSFRHHNRVGQCEPLPINYNVDAFCEPQFNLTV